MEVSTKNTKAELLQYIEQQEKRNRFLKMQIWLLQTAC